MQPFVYKTVFSEQKCNTNRSRAWRSNCRAYQKRCCVYFIQLWAISENIWPMRLDLASPESFIEHSGIYDWKMKSIKAGTLCNKISYYVNVLAYFPYFNKRTTSSCVRALIYLPGKVWTSVGINVILLKATLPLFILNISHG